MVSWALGLCSSSRLERVTVNIICSLSDLPLKSGPQTDLDWGLRQCCLCSAAWPYRPPSWSVGLRSHKSMMAQGTRDTLPSHWFVLSLVGSLRRQMEILLSLKDPRYPFLHHV